MTKQISFWFIPGIVAGLLASAGTARAVEVLVYQNGFESADACAWNASVPAATCDPDMVFVPAGAFTMGSNDGQSDEQPVHTITLSAFWIDRHEVTVDDYLSCVADTACVDPNGVFGTNDYCNYGAPGRGSHPVNCIDRAKATAYCTWASKRLPTEAEWEKAARGALDSRTYPWGDTEASCDYAVMSDDLAGGTGCGADQTDVVGLKPAGLSVYGGYDMAGNVWEWVSDWYDATYYATSPATNPTGPATGTTRIVRGGSWFHDFSYQRLANRNSVPPSYSTPSTGFRCARPDDI
ncbi:MAG: SUMF1/EgtB/PvdO family nonheme iron enzyme [bacterium]